MIRSRLVWSFLLLAIAGGAALVVAPAAAQETERLEREIAATQEGWIDTGITLAAGETAALTVLGRASWDANRSFAGPEGTLIEWCAPIAPGLPVGSVLARVAAGAPVLAMGATVNGPGQLRIGYNDCLGSYFDNSGSFSISLLVTRAPPPPAVVATPEPPKQKSSGWSFPNLAGAIMRLGSVVGVLALALGIGFIVWRAIVSRIPRFDPSARLESSAWIAPIRLRELQGERFPKRTLSVGGPDADVDFGVAGVRARLIPTDAGGTRLEKAVEGEQILVNDMPLLLAQRLGSGSRVKIGNREFTYFEESLPRQRSGPGAGTGRLPGTGPRAAA